MRTLKTRLSQHVLLLRRLGSKLGPQHVCQPLTMRQRKLNHTVLPKPTELDLWSFAPALQGVGEERQHKVAGTHLRSSKSLMPRRVLVSIRPAKSRLTPRASEKQAKGIHWNHAHPEAENLATDHRRQSPPFRRRSRSTVAEAKVLGLLNMLHEVVDKGWGLGKGLQVPLKPYQPAACPVAGTVQRAHEELISNQVLRRGLRGSQRMLVKGFGKKV